MPVLRAFFGVKLELLGETASAVSLRSSLHTIIPKKEPKGHEKMAKALFFVLTLYFKIYPCIVQRIFIVIVVLTRQNRI